ncbi:serine/arginine repetitive matrix protein 1-like isoform X2 [Cyprinodon tularosa]|uniref:serine/arginine repetitive matrix protein 1-like isoform X2 n=1 Tax=Cyprinodon tularosa TaxID=77115 RepID=UPI0018E29039|nr:serine/arginine repetitive matrix protein 1-like isoform X2 [Cyprinodon tularosa]
MKRHNRNTFQSSSRGRPAPLGLTTAKRVPQQFIEAMKRISGTPEVASKPQLKQPSAKEAVDKWKPAFQAVDKQKEEPEEKNPKDATRASIYDPSSPLSSDSDAETSLPPDRQPPPPQDISLRSQHLSADRDSRRWEASKAEATGPRLEYSREMTSTLRASPPRLKRDHQPLGYVERGPDIEAPTPPKLTRTKGEKAPLASIYDPSSPLSSDSDAETSLPPDRQPPPPQDISLRSQHLSADRDSRRWEASKAEATGPRLEYSREMTSTLRASPPRLKRDHQPLGYVERGPDIEAPTPPKLTRTKGEKAPLDKCPITCDLCDVKLSNAQELEDHLDSKGHWDTLEYIQRSSNYDDMAVAFLQEVMVYKSQHCSRAVEETALPGLQENHHMSKVEMLYCAACKVHVSTSAAEVQAHISSLEHLSNSKEFEVQQRRSCLSKAEAMLKKLQPQFDLFLKGTCPFE